jgi:hypothetical protein
MIKHKKCNCDDEDWEEIVVNKDNHYNFRTVIYYHCSNCGEDFRVEDFFPHKEVFYKAPKDEKCKFTDIVDKFNNWETDIEAKKWLVLMDCDLSEIEYVKAERLSNGFKTDVQVQVTLKLKHLPNAQNLKVKLVSNKKVLNQIDKRWVDDYAILWKIPSKVVSILKRYTGEILPTIKNSKDKRRMFINEFSEQEIKLILGWVKKNQTLIVSDILKGRGQFSAEWMLVAQKVKSNSRWVLKPMNYCLNYYGNGEIIITPKGNLKIAKIGMQRKGGDKGRLTANMLQFKIDPTEKFDN